MSLGTTEKTPRKWSDAQRKKFAATNAKKKREKAKGNSVPLREIKKPVGEKSTTVARVAPGRGSQSSKVEYSRTRIEGMLIEADEKLGEVRIAMGNARILVRTR